MTDKTCGINTDELPEINKRIAEVVNEAGRSDKAMSERTCGNCANGFRTRQILCAHEPDMEFDVDQDHLCHNNGWQPRTDTRDFDKLAEVARDMQTEFGGLSLLLEHSTDIDAPNLLYRISVEYAQRLADCGVTFDD